MTKDELRAECASAADPPMAGFAGTAIKVTAEKMGLLPDEALAAYDAGLKLSGEGRHVEAFALYRRMAALVLERLDATEPKTP